MPLSPPPPAVQLLGLSLSFWPCGPSPAPALPWHFAHSLSKTALPAAASPLPCASTPDTDRPATKATAIATAKRRFVMDVLLTRLPFDPGGRVLHRDQLVPAPQD